MRRLILALFLAVTGWSSTSLVAHPALAANLCVGSAPGCFSTIQAAVNAAQSGDTIRIAPGSFAGDIAIDKSLRLIGAGPEATTIRGGGPVLTIGQDQALTEPTLSIKGVTITGGVTTSATECGPALDVCVTRYHQATALGGGIEVPPAAGLATGATVTISNSVITGNRAAPIVAVPSATHLCLGSPCPFAEAAGGGIDSWGTMTLTNTTVSANQAGGAVNSESAGGGIVDEAGNRLTLINSVVSGNHATSSPPNGRFAYGGGILVDNGGTFVIKNSVVSNNDATLSSTFPQSVEMSANTGGISAGSGGATIDNSRIDGNTVRATDLNGEPSGYDAGICVCGVSAGPLVMRNSSVSDNRVIATVSTTADTGPDGGALEFDGPATVSNTQITGNTATVTSPTGTAGAVGAISALNTSPALIRNSVISGNTMSASSTTGTATVQGGAIVTNGVLELRNDQISGNTGTATAPAGSAQGGGIWNGLLFNPPPVQLTLENTSVTDNTLTASPGLTIQGGGLFTDFLVTLRNSVIANNVPDQCYGC